MLIKLFRGLSVRLLLLSLVTPALAFVAVLLANIAQAPAQVQTAVYAGPSFQVSSCVQPTGPYPPNVCITGSISASVTFVGACPTSTNVISIAASSGAGSLTYPGNYFSNSFSCDLHNQLASWLVQGWKDNLGLWTSQQPYIAINSGPPGGATDQAEYVSACCVTEWGYVHQQGYGHWINGRSLGSPCARSGGCGTGEPIDLGSGNVFDQITDYETAGQNKLSLIRYYNSMAAQDSYATSMGTNWRTNYDRYLHIINPSAIYGVEAERPDGAIISFTSSSGTYTPDSDVDLKLTVSGSTWTLTDQNDTIETYTASGSKATLNSIKQRNGYTQALTYFPGGQIRYVSDSYARTLTFGYSSGLLSALSTPEFTSGLTYSYVAYASAGRTLLSSVTYATSPATHQTYLYENANLPNALTGITDENGNRYATWGYDSAGRGILSELAGAVNFTSVSYDDTTGNRSTTGPLGIVNTYKFTVMQGVPKITEIDRAANSPVVAATETIRYDANGYRNSLTDWNSNNTSWTNNSHGLPTAITYASATTNAQTTNITYDLSWPHLRHTVSTNGLNANFTYDSAAATTSPKN